MMYPQQPPQPAGRPGAQQPGTPYGTPQAPYGPPPMGPPAGYPGAPPPKPKAKIPTGRIVLFVAGLVLVVVAVVIVLVGASVASSAEKKRVAAHFVQITAATNLKSTQDKQAQERGDVAALVPKLQQAAQLASDVEGIGNQLIQKEQAMIDAIAAGQAQTYNTNKDQANSLIDQLNAKQSQLQSLTASFDNG